MKKFFTLALLLCSLNLFAQIQVKVVDQETGRPIPDVVVRVPGKKSLTTTNEAGIFKLDYEEGDELQFSHLHYGTLTIKELPVEAIIYLKPRAHLINEVIVMGPARWHPAQTFVKSDYTQKVVQPKNVGELFSNINGFSLIKRGNYAMDPAFRASQYDQLNVQFDGGTKAMQACPNRMDPITTLVNPEEVTRIEIIKGPFSVRYGNTFGGIVNMVTSGVDHGEKLSGSVSSGYESNGESFVNMVHLSSDLQKFDFSGSFSQRDYGNYEDGNGTEIPSAFRSLGYSVKAGYEPTENQRLQLSLRQNFGRDVLHAGLMMDTDEDDSRIAGIDYSLFFPDQAFRGITAKAYHSFVDHIMSNTRRPSAASTEAVAKVEALTYGGKLEGRWHLGEMWRLHLGADVFNVSREGNRERLVKKNMMGQPLEQPVLFVDKIWQDSYVNDYGAYAEARILPDDKSAFTLGLRLDHVLAENQDPSESFIELYPDFSESSETLFSGTLSYKRIFSPAYSLELSFGRGARPANMEERFISHFNIGRDPYEYVGNPYLDAEVNNQFEIGFKGMEKWSETGMTSISFGASAFYSRYENYIVGVVDDSLNRKFMPSQPPLHPKVFRNLDKAFKTGFEAFGELNFAKNWNFLSEVSYVYTENEDFGESLPLTPPLVTRLRLGYEQKNFWAAVHYNLTADQNKISGSFGETATEGYEIMDLKAGFTLFEELNIGVGVLNVFDEQYHNHLSFSYSNQENLEREPIAEPGRNFTLFASYSF